MTVISDYTDEEQELLRRALGSAAIAISAASPGRQEEYVSEGFAAADLVLKSQPEYVGNTLVTSVLVELQSDIKNEHLFPNYVDVASAPGAGDEAMIVLGRTAALLDAKATPDEAAGYKRWLMEIAQAVAEAGKEDQGFLGHGGVMVNEAERTALAVIAKTLGVEPPTAA